LAIVVAAAHADLDCLQLVASAVFAASMLMQWTWRVRKRVDVATMVREQSL